MKWPRPRIVVSKCIEFAACRYNGMAISDPFVRKMKELVDFVPVCPEIEAGLGVPRDPVRIVSENGGLILYQPATGSDVTAGMKNFCGAFLGSLGPVDGFLLKSGSPSCGPGGVKIYAGRDNASRTLRGQGFFADAVRQRFTGLPVEDEGRLRNFSIREHFLTSVFTLADFRNERRSASLRGLIAFHTRHKLLFMGYHQSKMREMGRIVAAGSERPVDSVFDEYEKALFAAFGKEPSFTSMINVLQHAMGGFKNVLSPEEKRFFLNSLDEYRDERIPLSAVLYILRAWSMKHGNDYLLGQSFMEPYPRELVEISDSGKGRKL